MPGGPLGAYLARARHARRPQTSPPLRGLRAGGRRCWLTKTGFGGATTLQMRWLIVRIYALEGVRGWNKVARRFRTLAPTSQRSRQTCARIVRLWLTADGRRVACTPQGRAQPGKARSRTVAGRIMTEDVYSHARDRSLGALHQP